MAVSKQTLHELILAIKTTGAKQASEVVKSIHTAAGSASHSMGELDRKNKGAAQSTSNITKEFAKMSQGLGGLVHVYATLAANVFALSAAFSILRESMQTDALIQSMNVLTIETGANMNAMAASIRDASNATLSLGEAMRVAAQGSTAGFDPSTMERIVEVAKGASKALGRSLPDSIDRLVRGMVKLEPELLDELGIMTRVDDANKVYARTLGKTVTALTGWEKRQAFANAVLTEGEAKFKDIAASAEGNPYEKIAASLKDLMHAVTSFVASPIADFFQYITESVTLLVTGIALLSRKLLGSLMPSFASWADSVMQKSEIASRAFTDNFDESVNRHKVNLGLMNDEYKKLFREIESGAAHAATQMEEVLDDIQLNELLDLDEGFGAALDEQGSEFFVSGALSDEGVRGDIIDSLKEQKTSLELINNLIEEGGADNLKDAQVQKDKNAEIDLTIQKLETLGELNDELVAKAQKQEQIARKAAIADLTGRQKKAKLIADEARARAKGVQHILDMEDGWRSAGRVIWATLTSTKQYYLDVRKSRMELIAQPSLWNKITVSVRVAIQSVGFYLTALKAVALTVASAIGTAFAMASQIIFYGKIIFDLFTDIFKIDLTEEMKKFAESNEDLAKSFELTSKQVEKFYDLLSKGRALDAFEQNLTRMQSLAKQFGNNIEKGLAAKDSTLGLPSDETVGKTTRFIRIKLRELEEYVDKMFQDNLTDSEVWDVMQDNAVNTVNDIIATFSKLQKIDFAKTFKDELSGVGLYFDTTTLQFGAWADGASEAWKEMAALSKVLDLTNPDFKKFLKYEIAIIDTKAAMEEYTRLMEQQYAQDISQSPFFLATQQVEALSAGLVVLGKNVESTGAVRFGLLSGVLDAEDSVKVVSEQVSGLYDNIGRVIDIIGGMDAIQKELNGELDSGLTDQNKLLVNSDTFLAMITGWTRSLSAALKTAKDSRQELLKVSLALEGREASLASFTQNYNKALSTNGALMAERARMQQEVNKSRIAELKISKLSLEAQQEIDKTAKQELQALNLDDLKAQAKLIELDAQISSRKLAILAASASLRTEMTAVIRENLKLENEIGEVINLTRDDVKALAKGLMSGNLASERALELYKAGLKIKKEEADLQEAIASSYKKTYDLALSLKEAAQGGVTLAKDAKEKAAVDYSYKVFQAKVALGKALGKQQESVIEEYVASGEALSLKNTKVVQQELLNNITSASIAYKNSTNQVEQIAIQSVMQANLELWGDLLDAEEILRREQNTNILKFKSVNEAAAATWEQVQRAAREGLQNMTGDVEQLADTIYNSVNSGADAFIDSLVAGEVTLTNMFQNIGKAMLTSVKEDLTVFAKNMLKRAITSNLFKVKSESQPIGETENATVEAARRTQDTSLKTGIEAQQLTLEKISNYLANIDTNIGTLVNTPTGGGGASGGPGGGATMSTDGSGGGTVINTGDSAIGEVLKEKTEADTAQKEEDSAFFKENIGYAAGAMTLAIGAATDNQSAMWGGVIMLFTQAITQMMIANMTDFAKGGIMTSKGPLNMYSKGGVANSPQVSVFGEGRQNEAYVPLPDNRSIPVTLQGGGGGGDTAVNVNVNIDSNGGVDTTEDGTGMAAGKQLGYLISGAVKQELVRQQSPGGLLAGRRR